MSRFDRFCGTCWCSHAILAPLAVTLMLGTAHAQIPLATVGQSVTTLIEVTDGGPGTVTLALDLLGRSLDAPARIFQSTLSLLVERSEEPQRSFFLYLDHDSALNHGFFSGFFGEPTANMLSIDTNCVDDPEEPLGCSKDSSRIDRERGTVVRITFDPIGVGQFAGLIVEEPEGFLVDRVGRGYDLRGATAIEFDVRSPTPGGIGVRFGFNDRGTNPEVPPLFERHIDQSDTFSKVVVPFHDIGLTDDDLEDVQLLFTIAVDHGLAAGGGTLLLDNIRLVPTPASQADVLGLPLATATFGVGKAPGDPFGPDETNKALATTYESSLTSSALLQRGGEQDRAAARVLADTLVYALEHDNTGVPLPGSGAARGLHSGYMGGALPFFNSQRPSPLRPVGLQGDARLAGYSGPQSLCGDTGFCLVLEGATGGNNAFAILALVDAYRAFGTPAYSSGAQSIGNWIWERLADQTFPGYGGYVLGFEYEFKPVGPPVIKRMPNKSVENNAVIFAAMTALAQVEREAGHNSAALMWEGRARHAANFVLAMRDAASGCFHAGTVPAGTRPGAGIEPLVPSTRGNDTINGFLFLDSTTIPVLSLAGSTEFGESRNWEESADCVLGTFGQQVNADGQPFDGFNLVERPSSGPNGIAWEFTAQVIVMMRYLDGIEHATRYAGQTEHFLDELLHAREAAPFGDGIGITASTLEGRSNVSPRSQCLSTPFQCIPQRVGLAATAWATYAELGVNPLASSE